MSSNTASDSNGRGRNAKNNSKSFQSKKSSGYQKSGSKFEGETEQLKSHTYFLGSAKQARNFITTTDAIVSYIRKEFDEGDDMAISLKMMKEFDFDAIKPKIEIKKETTILDEYLLKGEVDRYLKRKDKYRTNRTKAYEIIIGQCTKGLRNKLEARKDWGEIEYNPIKLLKAIKELLYNYQDSRYPAISIVKAMKTLLNIKQEDGENMSDYIKRFNTTKELFETQVGIIELDKWIEQDNTNYSGMVGSKKKPLIEEYFNKMLAYIFITGCEMNKAEKLVEDLSNDYAKGDNKQRGKIYPQTIQEAAELVLNYKNYVNTQPTKNNRNSYGQRNSHQKSSFAQNRSNNDKDYSNYTCYKCGERGHIATFCPKNSGNNNNKNRNATSNVQQGKEDNNQQDKDDNNNSKMESSNTQVHHGWSSCQATSTKRDSIKDR